MNDHSLIEELSAIEALGGLDQADLRLLSELRASHGDNCAECRAIERDFGEIAGRLGFSLEPMPVSEVAEARLISALATDDGRRQSAPVQDDGEDEQSVPTVGRRRTGGPRPWIRIVAATVAAAMLVAGGIGVGYLALPHGQSTQQALASFLPGAQITPFSSSQGGQLQYVSKQGSNEVFVVGSGIRPLAAGHVYQLWTISGKTPAPGPTFVSTNGEVLVELQADLSGSQLMAVTVEPEGGSLQPTTDPIFTAPIAE